MKRLFSLSEVEDTLRLLVISRPVLGQSDFSLAKEAERIFSVTLPNEVRNGKTESSFAEIVHWVTEALSANGRLLCLVS